MSSLTGRAHSKHNKYVNELLIGMKISELCKLIEESIHSGKYPLDQKIEKQMASQVQVINRSSSDDLKDEDINIEVRLRNFMY